MMRVLVVATMFLAFACNATANPAPDPKAAERAAVEFLSVIDKGELDKAMGMFTPPVTPTSAILQSMAGQINPEAEVELKKLLAQETARAIQERRSVLERDAGIRRDRGAAANHEVVVVHKLHDSDGYTIRIQSDAKKPAPNRSGDVMKAFVSITVVRDASTAAYRVQQFQAE